MGQSNFSIRGEARYRHAIDTCGGDCQSRTDFIASLGVQYRFGGEPVIPPPNTDTDLDGVLDMWDECPDTPRGTQVSSSGCPLLDGDRDADGDRVPDNRDECPNTPVGAAVNNVGCELDSDRDGVPTGEDRCPSSRPGANVDMYGCENDGDSDGVPDHQDSCPRTRQGARVDVYGCEIEEIIHLPGLNFQTGQDVILPGAEYVLRDAAATLNKHPSLLIEVAGHTDDVGPGDINYSLSERRAVTVRDFLIRYGVDENRIAAVGYGEAQPIADNSTAEGRATNRRVELRVLN
jgi:OOP family OmpA-OmpF porin